MPEGVERTSSGAVGMVSDSSPHSRCQPVASWKWWHVWGLLCVRGTPRGRAGRGTVLLCAVILHNVGQIRLKLTAEDIQLDCSCHSVASIRVPPDAFVFPIALRQKHSALPFCVISIYVDLLLCSSFFVTQCCILDIDFRHTYEILIYTVQMPLNRPLEEILLDVTNKNRSYIFFSPCLSPL